MFKRNFVSAAVALIALTASVTPSLAQPSEKAFKEAEKRELCGDRKLLRAEYLPDGRLKVTCLSEAAVGRLGGLTGDASAPALAASALALGLVLSDDGSTATTTNP